MISNYTIMFAGDHVSSEECINNKLLPIRTRTRVENITNFDVVARQTVGKDKQSHMPYGVTPYLVRRSFRTNAFHSDAGGILLGAVTANPLTFDLSQDTSSNRYDLFPSLNEGTDHYVRLIQGYANERGDRPVSGTTFTSTVLTQFGVTDVEGLNNPHMIQGQVLINRIR